MSNYYVDIGEDIAAGFGAIDHPYNYEQFVNLFGNFTSASNTLDGDIINVRGNRITGFTSAYSNSENATSALNQCFMRILGTGKTGTFTIQAWQPELYGPVTCIGNLRCIIIESQTIAISQPLNIIFKNFIFYETAERLVTIYPTKTTGINSNLSNVYFKNCILKGCGEIRSYTNDNNINYNFYGCTLDASATQLASAATISFLGNKRTLSMLNMNENLLIADKFYIERGINQIDGNHNYSTISSAKVLITPGYINTMPIPTTIHLSTQLYTLSASYDALLLNMANTWYTDQNNVYYNLYGIGIFNNTQLIMDFRNIHDYNSDFFGNDRCGIGAFSFFYTSHPNLEYFVNITDGIPYGIGTSALPLNFEQFENRVDWLHGFAEVGEIFRIKGLKHVNNIKSVYLNDSSIYRYLFKPNANKRLRFTPWIIQAPPYLTTQTFEPWIMIPSVGLPSNTPEFSLVGVECSTGIIYNLLNGVYGCKIAVNSLNGMFIVCQGVNSQIILEVSNFNRAPTAAAEFVNPNSTCVYIGVSIKGCTIKSDNGYVYKNIDFSKYQQVSF